MQRVGKPNLAAPAGRFGLTLAVALWLCQGLAMAQWAALGPAGGGANLLAADAGRPGTYLAGTKNALLFETSDDGNDWQAVPFERSLSATLNALVASPCSGDTFYIGTTDSDPARAGIFKVTRQGDSWEVTQTLQAEPVMSVAVSGAGCRALAAGTLTGVLISEDAGKTWRRVSPAGEMEAQPIVSIAFAPDSANTLYAGTPKLPWKTTDGGKTWHPIHVGIVDDSDIFSIDVARDRILIGACSGIYRTMDTGAQWEKILGIPGESRRTYVIKGDPTNRQVVYAGTSNGLWKSADGGTTWSQKSPLPVRAIAFDPRDAQRVIMATDIGFWRTDDGAATLHPANSGFVNRALGAFLDTGNALLATSVYDVGAGTLFATETGERDWTARPGSTVFGEHIFHLETIPGFVFASGLERLFRSSDRGRTWKALPLTPGGMITGMRAIPENQTLLVAATTGIYVSRDLGMKWRHIPLPGGIARVDKLRSSFVGTTWGILSDGRVFLSNTEGATWTEAQIPSEAGPVFDFALNWKNEILVGTLRGLMFSNDAGRHWTVPSEGLPVGTVSSVLWHPTRTRMMFSVQNGTVWASADSGVTWQRVDISSAPNEAVLELQWSPNYDKLYAIGSTRGVFVRNVMGLHEDAINSNATEVLP
ncbi:MAG TPA: hypothetical protein VFY29_19945 [Terriglobia bacterium]|nr:hypothetical protein [Terriglobia bacterium]